MKNKKRLLALVLCLGIVLAGVLLLTVGVSGETDRTYVYDKADLLNEGEEEKLNELCASIEQNQATKGLKCYVVTFESLYKRQSYWGEDFLADIGQSENQDCVILIVTHDPWMYDDDDQSYFYYDFYKYGEADSRINQAEVNHILDDAGVRPNIKGGRISEGASQFLNLCSDAYTGRIGAPMSRVIVIAFVVSLVIGIIPCASIVAKYKMKVKPTNYPLDKYADLDLTGSKDIFIGSYVTTRRISTSSSGGGLGGSSHGGGSGHAGGR